jgi:multisubunit Na+/H+ antiporter MnhB subunit
MKTIAAVMAIGGAVTAVAVIVLYLAFRAFGNTAGKKETPVILLACLIVFLALCGALLLWTSFQ